MSDKKISVVLLGKEDSLKKALITNITGRDSSKITKTGYQQVEVYEHEIFKFTCIQGTCPELHIRNEFKNPDMFLLLVKDGLSKERVWEQIEELGKTTKKPTEEFKVVLPLTYNQSDTYPFNSLTTDQVLKELRNLAEERHLVPTFERSAGFAGSSMSTRETPMNETDAMFKDLHCSDDRNRFKRTHTDVTVKLVLLGMCGAGKSASGNTILGKNHFPSKASSKPVTSECQVEETVIDGKRIRVIDTPDMFGDDINPAVKAKHVNKCRELCQSGPCVFVLVMQVSRFTDGERDIMKKLEEAFGRRVHKRTVILFTRGDDLKREGMSLEDFLSSCQPDLKEIVEQCENRCVVFENRTSDSRQVRWLMQKVENVLEKQQDLCVNCTQSSSGMTFPRS